MFDYKALMADFRQHSHPENIAPMMQYMRDQFDFLGIKSKERRELERPYFKRAKQEIDWEALFSLWDAPEREFQYVVSDFIKENKNYLTPSDLPRLKRLIITKSWWDSVDALVKSLGDLVKRHPELKSEILDWSRDNNIWLRRAALLHQLGQKNDTDVDLLEAVIRNNLGSDEFFINKAIGWALRDYAYINPEWVTEFLQIHRDDLASLSYKEASKHINI